MIMIMSKTKVMTKPSIILLVWASIFGISRGIRENKFIKSSQCHVQERITKNCIREYPKLRSVSECLAQCSREHLCIGGSVSNDRVCSLHERCLINTELPCLDNDKIHNYWYKYCMHGRWDKTNQKCVCEGGNKGERCEDCPVYCESLRNRWELGGDPRVCLDYFQTKQPLLKLTCGWSSSQNWHGLYIVARNSGGLSFNRTWNEYVYGFYEDKNNFWVGLEDWHQLTKDRVYDLLVMVVMANNAYQYCLYTHFRVQSSASDYGFIFSNPYCGGAPIQGGDCLSSVQNVRFSTSDRDNDGDAAQNCAGRSGFGWWHTAGCNTPCNILTWGDLISWPGNDLNQVSYIELHLKM